MTLAGTIMNAVKIVQPSRNTPTATDMSATGLMDPESKHLRRAFKARRRTELGLLVAASVIITGAYALMIYGNTAKVPTDVAPLPFDVPLPSDVLLPLDA